MAYNPSIYNPYGQPQPYSWSQPTWAAPQPSATQPVNGLVKVTGLDGAKAYQMPPNSSMPLFDENEDVMYVKTTDGAGFPTVRAFSFKPMEQEQQKAVDYVSREDFDELVKRVDGLTPKTRTRKAAADAE